MKNEQRMTMLSEHVHNAPNSGLSSVTDESIRQGLEAARTLIQMANEGRISIPAEGGSVVSRGGELSQPPLNSQGRHPSHNCLASTDGYPSTVSGSSSGSSRDIDGHPQHCDLSTSKANSRFLPGIFSTVLSKAMDSKPMCALNILAPDWNVCNWQNPQVGKASEPARVVTYIRGAEGERGTFSATVGHEDVDHIFLPTKSLNERFLKLDKSSHDECMRLFFQEGTQIFQLDAGGLPTNIKDEQFLEHWRDAFPLREQRLRDIMPFDDERVGTGKLETPNGSPHIFKLLRHIAVNSSLALMDVNARSLAGQETGVSGPNLDALDMAIDLDRASHLWLSWSQMPMLESVLLDLRIYSHDLNSERGCISKDEIKKRAGEMGRWLRLKLLVIAGLQSYSFETNCKSYTAAQIEEEDELDGEPNWIKLFMPALRPGAIHTVVCYLSSPTVSLKQFSGPGAPPPHQLLSHVYGVKNFYTSFIRLYAAYHITNPQLYDLAIWTFVGVLFLYITEVFVYKTARFREAAFPYVIAGISLVWMVMQRDWYLSR
ncbi:hypothetical protein AAE478_002226 [Parahypoxylon ruwenzoriense]